MQDFEQPSKIPVPWATSASASYIRAIPTASQIGTTPGAASFTDGFPPLNALPVAAGGIPPFMQDMNGILYAVTAWLRWMQAGGPIPFDQTFANAIGGYPNGAVVASATTAGLLWRSTVENNTSNPDSGGSGWTGANSGRLINIRSWVTAGTYTYAPTAGTRSIVILVLGAGGAGGGIMLTQGGYGVGSGGASGSFTKSRLTSGFANIGMVVGAGGTPVSAAFGNPGGTSSFGNLMSASGGGGGQNFAAFNAVGNANQGAPGLPGVGGNIINAAGQPGMNGTLQGIGAMSGQGAPSIFGGGGNNTSRGNGNAGVAPGAGGSGAAADAQGGGPYAGGPGSDGAIIIEEYA